MQRTTGAVFSYTGGGINQSLPIKSGEAWSEPLTKMYGQAQDKCKE